MKKIRLFLSAVFFMCINLLFAQTITVNGTVTDEQTGEPVAFASVFLKGNPATGTSTTEAGKFTLSVPPNGTLIVSLIGYTDKEVAINNKAALAIKMQPEAVMLEDVMVVAYGTADKKSFSGSASTISGEKLASRPVSNITKALAGMAAGVQIVSTTGQPGASASIRVRGVGSISAGQDPLIVLDGIPYDGALGSIAANDIESMTVLKDAAANSMYGARGANGVVLINTKKGQRGKTRIDLEIRGGFNNRGVPGYETIRNPGEFLELGWESLKNFGLYGTGNAQFLNGNLAHIAASKQLFSGSFGTGGYNPYGGVPSDMVIDPSTGKLNPSAKLMYWDDWMKIPFQTGFRQEYIASMSGGNEKTSFYISASYLDDQGYTVNSYFKRFSTRAKIEHQATKWMKLGINIGYSKSFNNTVKVDNGGTSSYTNLFMTGQQLAPIYPIYQYDQATGQALTDALGNKLYDFGTTMGTRPFGANSNPLAQQVNDFNETDRDLTTAIAFVEIRFLKDFKFTANVSAESNNYMSDSYQSPLAGDAGNVGGRNWKYSGKSFTLNSQQLITYNKSIDKHNIDVLIGHEINSNKFKYLYGGKENFLIPDNPEFNNAARIVGLNSYNETTALDSYMTRAQYNYSSKYYFTASYRRDGSSRFHPDVRWGNFWSVGASWRMEQESFLKDVSWIDGLKLRASYGTQGNDQVGRSNAYSELYSIVPQNGEIGISYSFRGNPTLTWEKSKNFNLGIDISLWNRFRATAEYYNKTTTDLLYSKTLPISWGSPSSIFENTINMKNSGFEVELSYDILKSGDFYWNIAGNITYQKNKLTKLPMDKDPEGKGYRNGSYYYKVGNSIYDYHLYESAGVDPKTGFALFYQDVFNADGSLKEVNIVEDPAKATYRENGKHGLVDFYGGVSTAFSWKGIDLNIQTTYQIGGYGYDSQYQSLMQGLSTLGVGLHIDARERWTTLGQETSVPKLEFGTGGKNAGSTSNRFLTSKSMFSLQNVTLGYTFPSLLTKRIGVDRLRIYATGDNLWLASARKGFDPRVSFGGGASYNYSATRTISLGINLNF